MASKMVNAAADASVYVESSLRQNGDELARRLVERWRPLLPANADMPDPATMIRLMADDLAACREAMVETDAVDIAQRGGLSELCTRRDAAAARLGQLYRDTRGIYQSTRSREAARAVGFDQRTEEHPSRLAEQAQRVIRSLRDPRRTTRPRDAAPEFDPHVLANTLEKPWRELDDLLTEIVRARHRGKSTSSAKQEAFARHKQALSSTAGTAVHLYKLVGMEDEASKVRRKVPRRRR